MADSGFDFSVPNTAKPTHERSMVGFFVMVIFSLGASAFFIDAGVEYAGKVPREVIIFAVES